MLNKKIWIFLVVLIVVLVYVQLGTSQNNESLSLVDSLPSSDLKAKTDSGRSTEELPAPEEVKNIVPDKQEGTSFINGDFEKGNWKPWKTDKGTNAIKMETSIVREGKYAVKMTIGKRNLESFQDRVRVELTYFYDQMKTWQEGDGRRGSTLWYSWSVRLENFPDPSNEKDGYNADDVEIIMGQVHGPHAKPPIMLSPFAAVILQKKDSPDGKWRFWIHKKRYRPFEVLKNAYSPFSIKKDTWYDIIMRIKWAADSTGEVQVKIKAAADTVFHNFYEDSTTVKFDGKADGIIKGYTLPDTAGGYPIEKTEPCYFRIGMYEGIRVRHQNPIKVYYDNVKVSRTDPEQMLLKSN